MAAGVLGVRGPRPFQLGREARAHQGVARLVLDCHPVRAPSPRAQCRSGGDACGLVQGLLQAGEPVGGEGDGRAGRDIGGPHGLETSRGRQGQPATHRVAVDAPQVGPRVAAVGLTTGQPVAPLPTRFLVAGMVMTPALFERRDRFVKRRDGVVPRVSSRPV
jgi:hypothetical protein